MSQSALILSSGRTGTRFLAHYLGGSFDGVVARHEPPGSRTLRLASHAWLRRRIADDSMRRLLDRHVARQRASLPKGVLYVESNPYLAAVAGLADAAFERPTIVHIVRDPRDVVRSALNHGSARGMKEIANRFVPYWYPDVARLMELPEEPSPVGRAAAWWCIVNDRIAQGLATSSRYGCFRYEEILGGPTGPALEPLLAHLGLEFRQASGRVDARERINESRREHCPRWPSWPEAWCREVALICGERMARYGYGGEPAWRRRVAP